MKAAGTSINMPNEEDTSSSQLHHVSIKPPPFMETAVSGWFAIFDAQFHLRKITSEETKFYHILAALPPDTISKISPEILTKKSFSELKTALIELHEHTKPELFEKLISSTTMTGRPSVFLGELRGVATKVGVSDDLVRHKFVQALPITIGTVLAAQKELTLNQLGKLADELIPLEQAHCLAVPSASSFTRKSTDNSHTFKNHAGLRPYHANQRPKVCRAHIFFGHKARSCKPWCQWPNKSPQLQCSSRSSSPSPSVASEN